MTGSAWAILLVFLLSSSGCAPAVDPGIEVRPIQEHAQEQLQEQIRTIDMESLDRNIRQTREEIRTLGQQRQQLESLQNSTLALSSARAQLFQTLGQQTLNQVEHEINHAEQSLRTEEWNTLYNGAPEQVVSLSQLEADLKQLLSRKEVLTSQIFEQTLENSVAIEQFTANYEQAINEINTEIDFLRQDLQKLITQKKQSAEILNVLNSGIKNLRHLNR